MKTIDQRFEDGMEALERLSFAISTETKMVYRSLFFQGAIACYSAAWEANTLVNASEGEAAMIAIGDELNAYFKHVMEEAASMAKAQELATSGKPN